MLWLSLLAVLVALVSLVLAWLAWRRPPAVADPPPPAAEAGEMDGKELAALRASALGMGRTLARLEGELRQLREKLERLERMESGDGGRYAQAIRMVAKGASVDDLVEDFGLSRSEAQLLVTLHQNPG